ncbi:MAG: hypothetical protein BMS9Abin12_1730 [Acidimicrobiia bacterium]|nr:MAG: hypothetical protein BMS9Abin12_1730 [Acidimicrobiia bacterium]
MSEIETNDYQERLDRISELFAGLVAQAESVSQYRCPYRDRNDHCTAMFTCRNQQPINDDPEVLDCGNDGTFDYSDAWQSHPRNRDRMKHKIETIRLEGQRRRAEGDASGGKP